MNWKYHNWYDLNGIRREPLYAIEDANTRRPDRRFCQRCGRLRVTYLHRDVVRCVSCSKIDGAPCVRNAFSSVRAAQVQRDFNKQSRTRSTNNLPPLTPNLCY